MAKETNKSPRVGVGVDMQSINTMIILCDSHSDAVGQSFDEFEISL